MYFFVSINLVKMFFFISDGGRTSIFGIIRPILSNELFIYRSLVKVPQHFIENLSKNPCSQNYGFCNKRFYVCPYEHSSVCLFTLMDTKECFNEVWHVSSVYITNNSIRPFHFYTRNEK